MKTGSGLATSYTYEDHRNVKTSVSNSFGNTAVSTYTYEYDELGRRKSVKNTGPAFINPNFNIYGYNDRSEVTASNSFTGEDLANKNNPLSDRSRAYNYDPIGNRKTANEASINLTYAANSLNQYESISGGANPETPAYDLDGNMTVSKGMVYTYNAENRLIEAAPQTPQQGSVKSTYIYDYMGRRARKTLYTYSSGSWQKQKDQSFVYDGWNMVKESEKTSDSSPEVPVYYVWGLDLSLSMQGAGGVGGLIASVKSGNEYLYSYDGNGNVGQMVKSTDGSIAARYEYDPFGKTLFAEGPIASENPYRFSTKCQDAETGFYYYGFRFYSAEMGRWVNRDPASAKATEMSFNIYGFISNKTLLMYDVLGLWGSDIHRDGTYTWAKEVHYTDESAKMIGDYDEAVDGGTTSPYPIRGDQRYHFNRGPGEDTRKILFEEFMKKAKDECSWKHNCLETDNPEKAVEYLGTSLHPMQDIFAHGAFGKNTEGNIWIFHNFYSADSDAPLDPFDRASLVDDPSMDSTGLDGVADESAMQLRDMGLWKADWAKFKKGRQRFNKTREKTKVALNDFYKHLKEKAKLCGKCQEYFIYKSGLRKLSPSEMREH